MESSSFSDILAEPAALLLNVEQTSDPLFLQRCLEFTVAQQDNSWCLVHAYILWKLKDFQVLHDYLLNLPDSFHSSSRYWLLLGLSQKYISSSSYCAEVSFQKGLSIQPDNFDLNYNLANQISTSRPRHALRLYERCLNINAFHSLCWHNYGRLLRDLGFLDSAFSAYKTSVLILPSDPDTYCDLGISYFEFGFTFCAEKSFNATISFDTALYDVIPSNALSLSSDQFTISAVTKLDAGQKLAPASLKALFNLSLCFLQNGRYDFGWKLYEQRFFTHFTPSCCNPSSGYRISSLTQMSQLVSTPIIIWAEQGFGDTIQFVRYLSLLVHMGVSFTFHCQEQLVPLMRDWFVSSIKLEILEYSSLKKFCSPHCPLLSLPNLFNTNEFTIPSSSPIFIAPAACPKHLLIEQPPAGLSIGLVWSSNSNNVAMHRKKSISLASLMPLFMDLLDLDLIDLHSLQVGSDKNQLSPWLNHPRIFDWSDHLIDFADTAYVVNQLDLVICVDTAVAHLSASLRRSTFLLLPFDSDYRWLRSRNDSPWYPDVMRLFRQSSQNDWHSVVSSLRTAFDELFLVHTNSLASSKNLR